MKDESGKIVSASTQIIHLEKKLQAKDELISNMLHALKGADELLTIYARFSEPSLKGDGVAADIWKTIKNAINKAELK